MYDEEDIIESIKKISEKIDDEINSDEVNEEELFKLRYAQMIKGLYLTDEMINNR